MAAMSLGELYVRLSLRNAEFSKNLATAAKSVDQFGKRVNEVGSKLGGLGVAGVASLTGFVRAAAEVNKSVGADMKSVEGAFRALSVEVAQAVQPAIRSLADTVGKLAGFFRSLSPETKALIGNIAGYGSAALVAVGATAKLVGAITALAPLASAIAPLLLPLAGIAAAIGGIILLVGALKIAWDANLGGMRTIAETTFKVMLEQAKKTGQAVADAFLSGIGMIVSAFETLDEFFNPKPLDIRNGLPQRDGSVFGEKKKQSNRDRGLEALGLASSAAANFGKQVGADLKKSFEEGSKLLLGPLKDLFDGLLAKFNKTPSVRADAADKGPRSNLREDADWYTQTFGARTEWDDPARPWANNRASRVSGRPVTGGQFGTPMSKADQALGGYLEPTAAASVSRTLREKATAFAKSVGDTLADAARNIGTALAGVGQQFMSKLPGEAQGAINAGMQGFAAGGVMGGVAGVALEIGSQSEQFQSAMQVVSGIFATLAEAIGPMFEPLGRMFAALGLVLEAIVTALQPVFEFISGLFEIVTPLFVLIATVIEAFTPVLQLVMKVLNPVLSLLGLAFKGLFLAVKYLGLGVLYVVRAIAFVWDAMVSAVQWVLKIIDKLPFVDLSGAIKKLESWKFGDDVDRSIKKLKNMNWEGAKAAAARAESDYKAKTATDAATASMQQFGANLPDWYKVDLARFQAADPVGMGPATAAGTLAGSIEKVQSITNTNSNNTTVNVNVQGADAKKVVEQVKKEIERDRVKKTGTTASAANQW